MKPNFDSSKPPQSEKTAGLVFSSGAIFEMMRLNAMNSARNKIAATAMALQSGAFQQCDCDECWYAIAIIKAQDEDDKAKVEDLGTALIGLYYIEQICTYIDGFNVPEGVKLALDYFEKTGRMEMKSAIVAKAVLEMYNKLLMAKAAYQEADKARKAHKEGGGR